MKWPFVGRVKFELLNQQEDDNHFTKRLRFSSYKNVMPGNSKGYRKFIAHSGLNVYNVQYLKDDTLYFRVSVTVADHRPWLE